jgi:dihydrofolate reductase / thymidylate synthase
MKLNLILNRDENDIIGIDDELPYHIQDDFNWFQEKTLHNIVVMGYNTWKSLPKKPLKNRYNIVISNNHLDELGTKHPQPHKTFSSFEEFIDAIPNNIGPHDDHSRAMEKFGFSISPQDQKYQGFTNETLDLKDDPDIFIIGGSSLYQQAIQSDIVDSIFETRTTSSYLFSDKSKLVYANFKIDPNLYGKTYFRPMKTVGKIYYKKEDPRIKTMLEYSFNVYKKQQKINQDEMQYLSLLNNIYNNGSKRKTRNGEVISSFSEKMTFDLRNGFPLLTSKKIGWKTVLRELLWFIRGSTNNKELQGKNVHIWDGNASKEYLQSRGLDYEEGDLGPIYGYQWRNFGGEYHGISSENGRGVDQIKYMIDLIQNDPSSRRIIMSAWNPSDLDKMALPPCHILFQIYVDGDYIDGQLYQRSGDMFLGVPFNIASYSFFLHIIGKLTKKTPRFLYHVLGDAHIYSLHYKAIEQQLIHDTRPFPSLIVSDQLTDIDSIDESYFNIENYNHAGVIKAPMVV